MNNNRKSLDDLLKEALSNKPEDNEVGSKGRKARIEKIRSLLDAKADIKTANVTYPRGNPDYYRPALIDAIDDCDLGLVQLLFEKKADANVKEIESLWNDRKVGGQPALIVAIQMALLNRRPPQFNRLEHMKIVRLLLDNRADVDLEDLSGKTARSLSEELKSYQYPEVQQMVVDEIKSVDKDKVIAKEKAKIVGSFFQKDIAGFHKDIAGIINEYGNHLSELIPILEKAKQSKKSKSQLFQFTNEADFNKVSSLLKKEGCDDKDFIAQKKEHSIEILRGGRIKVTGKKKIKIAIEDKPFTPKPS